MGSRTNITPRLILLRGAIGSGKTTVGSELKARAATLEIIEVDDIKVDRDGSTKCNPSEDFPEAGRRASEAMLLEHDAVVVEPLCSPDHVRLVLNAAGVAEGACYFVWLQCSVKTSMERKRGPVSESTIRRQHCRYEDRFVPQRELVVNTDAKSPEAVAARILRFLSAIR